MTPSYIPTCTCDREGHGCEIHGRQPRERPVHLACGHDTWRIDLRCEICP
jgi:hypothetical protein